MNIMHRFLSLSIVLLILNACNGPGQKESSSTPTNEPTAAQPTEANDVMAEGKSIYNKFCLVCHQADGSGVEGLYPPLVNTDWVQGDKERLIKVVLNGQEGPIEVNGESYNNVMPAQDFLKNNEVAAVLTYIRQNFENNASAVTASDVEQVRASL